MHIPDEAVEAAVKALFEDGCGEPKVDAATALEAAAPIIAAQALRDAQATLRNGADLLPGERAAIVKHCAGILGRRADELEASK